MNGTYRVLVYVGTVIHRAENMYRPNAESSTGLQLIASNKVGLETK